jgi:hypothetical protein
MSTYRIQTSLQADSGLPRDQFVSSLYVSTSIVLPPIYNGWCNRINEFYKDLASVFSPVMSQTGHVQKVYLVGAPLDSPPVHVQTFDFTYAPTGSALPNEVASCLTFHGAPHAGWQRQSTYGRIYMGPWNTAATEMVSGGGSIVSANVRGSIINGAVTMAAGINALDGTWVVHSKLHSADTKVTQVSMNDEWDTVRSRGFRQTARTIAAIAQP